LIGHDYLPGQSNSITPCCERYNIQTAAS
jgi:hypothetical protein